MAADISSSSRCDQARPHLDDGDFASESPEHLPELQPDIAAAHDDQVPGKKINVHHRAVGEVLDLIEAGHAEARSRVHRR